MVFKSFSHRPLCLNIIRRWCYECFRYYKDNNKDYDFTYYNFAWGPKGAERDINALKDADIVVFPAVQEFIYFADAMHPRDVEKSQAEIRKTYEHLNC